MRHRTIYTIKMTHTSNYARKPNHRFRLWWYFRFLFPQALTGPAVCILCQSPSVLCFGYFIISKPHNLYTNLLAKIAELRHLITQSSQTIKSYYNTASYQPTSKSQRFCITSLFLTPFISKDISPVFLFSVPIMRFCHFPKMNGWQFGCLLYSF